ncbi:MAG: hypothetical protein JSU96_05395 [Acidobacteriota bacterium]|nr:MAG: hypothetical protein JSU96_05395 [Acidobacteriota bacterium]
MKSKSWIILGVSCFVCLLPLFAQEQSEPRTPVELVATYEALADTILAADRAEEDLVKGILATTYGHAQAARRQAEAKIAAGEDSRSALEALAAYVSQLGNEGDSAVAGVRKRLVEGGHHHNAKGEEEGIYDEGFVIVTKAAKKVFLDAATEIGRSSREPSVEKLNAAWSKVEKEYKDLMASVAH